MKLGVARDALRCFCKESQLRVREYKCRETSTLTARIYPDPPHWDR